MLKTLRFELCIQKSKTYSNAVDYFLALQYLLSSQKQFCNPFFEQYQYNKVSEACAAGIKSKLFNDEIPINQTHILYNMLSLAPM